MLSARSFLVRGLLAGLIAGFFAFGVAFVVGEPSVSAAIALESETGGHSHEPGTSDDHTHADETAPGSGEETEVPRSLQSTVGLLTGTVVAGVTLGGLVGVLSALALGRLGTLSPRATVLTVTALGFVSLYVIPTLAYPPNPPAVGSGDTIGVRTALYFTLVAISVIAMVAAVLGGRRLVEHWGGWYAALAAGGAYLVVTLACLALLPTFDEVPADFPASVLFEFRRASFVTQLALWTALGLVLAELAQRLLGRSGPARTTRTPAAVSR